MSVFILTAGVLGKQIAHKYPLLFWVTGGVAALGTIFTVLQINDYFPDNYKIWSDNTEIARREKIEKEKQKNLIDLQNKLERERKEREAAREKRERERAWQEAERKRLDEENRKLREKQRQLDEQNKQILAQIEADRRKKLDTERRRLEVLKQQFLAKQQAEIERQKADNELSQYSTKPPFNCFAKLNLAERTICNTPILGKLDNKLSYLYNRLRNRLVKGSRSDRILVQDQRNWLARRNNCNNNIYCIENIYRSRIRRLGNRPA